MDTAAASTAPAKNVRRQAPVLACKRCNVRHVRCDAYIIGTPCSNCKSAAREDCNYISSKRKRGSAGRFIPASELDDQSSSVSPSIPKDLEVHPRHYARADINRSTKTAQEAEFSLDLAKLYESEASPNPISAQSSGRNEKVSSPSHSTDTILSPAHVGRDDKASFFGESWYASFLLRATNNQHNQLHQLITPGFVHEKSQGNLDVADHLVEDDGLLEASDPKAFPSDIPPPALRDSLVEAYFSRFHVLFPVLDKTSFLSGFQDGSVSLTLLRCVLFVASIHCDAEICHRLGYKTRVDAGDTLFHAAKASFDAETDVDRVVMLQCSFLLHYWWGKPTNFRDALWWLATAIRSAQGMGMHRSMRDSKMSQRSKGHWKRIWWCLYISDRQVTMAVGSPMIINDLDCDVEDLEMKDLAEESEENAHYLLGLASFSRIVSSIYFCHLSPSRLHLSNDSQYRRNTLLEIQATLNAWYTNLPPKLLYEGKRSHHLAVVLQIVYNYHMIIFYQRLQRRRSKDDVESEDWRVVLEAASNVTRLVENALINWGPEYLPMICVTSIFAAMTAQYVDSQCSNGYKSQLSFQKLRSNLLSLRQFEPCYTLARWIRNLFKDIIERPGRSPAAQRSEGVSEVASGVPNDRRNNWLDGSSRWSETMASPPNGTSDICRAPANRQISASTQHTSFYRSPIEGSIPSDEHVSNQTSMPDEHLVNGSLWSYMTMDDPSPSQSSDSLPTELLEVQGRQFHPGLWFSGLDIGLGRDRTIREKDLVTSLF